MLDLAYCGHCSKLRPYHGNRCEMCKRAIWELSARVPDPHSEPLRTTSETFAIVSPNRRAMQKK